MGRPHLKLWGDRPPSPFRSPPWVTRLHHRWGAPEAEIFVFKCLPWPGFEPWTSQSNGRERDHSTTAPPQLPITLRNCVPNQVFDIFMKIITIYFSDIENCLTSRIDATRCNSLCCVILTLNAD